MKSDENAKDTKPQTKYLKDYKKPDYLVDTVDLEFDLDPETTNVQSTMKIRSDYDRSKGVQPMLLDGDELDFVSVAIDGRNLKPEEYKVDDKGLTILNPPEEFTLTVKNDIHPEKNTALEGVYVSDGNFCTQCEPEGFRRITYYPDHPDVMAKFTTLLRADKEKNPVLLSNGNPIEEGDLPNGKHFVKWEDPFPKPSYLYALVGGDLGSIHDTFKTMSGKEVKLGIYTEPGKEEKAKYAMDSLKRSMAWDEKVFGREYDLDRLNTVAVSSFNQGAMENKGLMIFNDAYVLADPKTATDANYEGVESVIGHEYFHNWTGNRVTVKNWFNLTLKEGLTVFRDQEFSSDERSRPVKRIDDVQSLRAGQFPEDAGPLAHPIKPKSYVEMNNFYTSTIYSKGAEVIRMTKNLLGAKDFRKATDLYFERNDGKAVGTEDWLKAMEDASGKDLKQFRNWYDQAGTPSVEAVGKYDAETKTYELTLKQSTKPTPGQPEKKPFMMPIEVGLLDSKGNDMPLKIEGEKGEAVSSKTLILNKNEQVFKFENVQEPPVLSANRGFTSPVNMKIDYTKAERTHLMAHDSDGFNRFEAGQQYGVAVMKDMIKDIQAGKKPKIDKEFVKAIGSYLTDKKLDKAFVAAALSLPSEGYMAQQMKVVDVDAIHEARKTLGKAIAVAHKDELNKTFEENKTDKEFTPSAKDAGERALKNTALAYISKLDDLQPKAYEQYKESTNMTDQMSSLATLAHTGSKDKDKALDSFYKEFKGDGLVINKWQSLQARTSKLEDVKKLMEHESFNVTKPNDVRAVVGGFAMGNPTEFHKKDGSGYQFLAEQIKKLDDINPMTAAKFVSPLGKWKNFDKDRQELMKDALCDILSKPTLRKNSYELAYKSLGDDADKIMKEYAIKRNKESFKKEKTPTSEEKLLKVCKDFVDNVLEDKKVTGFVNGAKGNNKLAHEQVVKNVSVKVQPQTPKTGIVNKKLLNKGR